MGELGGLERMEFGVQGKSRGSRKRGDEEMNK